MSQGATDRQIKRQPRKCKVQRRSSCFRRQSEHCLFLGFLVRCVKPVGLDGGAARSATQLRPRSSQGEARSGRRPLGRSRRRVVRKLWCAARRKGKAFSLGEIRMSSANQWCEIRILSLARAPCNSPRATSAFGNPKIGFENGHFAEIRAEIRRSTVGRIHHKNRCNDPNFHDPTCDVAKNVLPPNRKSRGANASQLLQSFCWFGCGSLALFYTAFDFVSFCVRALAIAAN